MSPLIIQSVRESNPLFAMALSCLGLLIGMRSALTSLPSGSASARYILEGREQPWFWDFRPPASVYCVLSLRQLTERALAKEGRPDVGLSDSQLQPRLRCLRAEVETDYVRCVAL